MTNRPLGPPPEELGDTLFECFVGRNDRYMIQQEDGSYIAVKRNLTKAVLASHAKGHVTVAAYTTNENGCTLVAILDIDSKDAAAKEFVIFALGWLKHFDIPCFLEPSGGKGYHVWVLFKCWVPAAKARALLQALVNDWNIDHEGELDTKVIELFPKQITPATFDNPGTGVKLPWGFHRKGQKWTPIMGADTKPLADWGLSAVTESPQFTESDLDAVLGEYSDIPVKEVSTNNHGHTSDEIVAMLTGPIPVGARRPTLVSLAGFFRHRGIHEDVAVTLLLPWAEKAFAEQLSAEEVERHVRGIYGRYGIPTTMQSGIIPYHYKVEVEL